MGRPMIEALGQRDYDTSTLVSVASSACLFSPSIKEQFLERFPNAVIIDAIGSSETGFGGMAAVVKGESHVGAPRVNADKQTHVLREDGTQVEPGTGEVGVLARTGHIPLRYHNDPEKSAKTFKEFNGIRYSIPGDFARVEADGTITMLKLYAGLLPGKEPYTYPNSLPRVDAQGSPTCAGGLSNPNTTEHSKFYVTDNAPVPYQPRMTPKVNREKLFQLLFGEPDLG